MVFQGNAARWIMDYLHLLRKIEEKLEFFLETFSGIHLDENNCLVPYSLVHRTEFPSTDSQKCLVL